MNYEEYGAEKHETLVLLHGGGLGPWNWRGEARRLAAQYRVLCPVLDGHAGSDAPFTSMQDCAGHLLALIDRVCGGRVKLIAGLSLGAQVLLETLARRNDVCEYALVESALVLPMKATRALLRPTFSLCYGLIARKWFARLQFASLHIRPNLFEDYYRDTCAITKENLIAFLQANAAYEPGAALSDTRARVLVLVGARERPIMKRSAEKIHRLIPASRLLFLKGLVHGELSLNRPEEYVKTLTDFMAESDPARP